MSDFIQIKCPNCGAPLVNADPTALSYKCPYCGTEFFNPNIKEQMQDAYVFPVNIDIQNFWQNVKNTLASAEDIPLDFLDPRIFSSKNVGMYYVPFYVFKGIIHSSWSCDFVTRVERERTKRDGTRETYYERVFTPGSGSPSGNYEYLCSGTENPDQRLDSFFRKYKQEMLGSLGKAKMATQGSLQGKVLPATDLQSLWKDRVEEHINKLGDDMCMGQAAQHRGQIRGFTSTTSIDRKEEMLYYLPVYILEVEYNEQKYYIIQDASNAFTATSLPTDKEYVGQKNELVETKKKNLKSDPISTLGPLAFLFGYGAIAFFGGSMLWKIIVGVCLWLILLLGEEDRYKTNHFIVAVAFFIPFAIFQAMDIGDDFWAFVCNFCIPLVISEIPAISYTSKESEKNKAHNKIVNDEFNKAMSSLTNERENERKLRVEGLS